jgi:hypothetical protein
MRRPNLVNVVRDEYVARHGHEQHGQVGDGVAEDPHGVAPVARSVWASPHSRVVMKRNPRRARRRRHVDQPRWATGPKSSETATSATV